MTRRQSEWPILTAEGIARSSVGICWNYDTQISLISNLGKEESSKIKLPDDINLFWITKARVSYRTVKIKQADYRMAHGIQGMKM